MKGVNNNNTSAINKIRHLQHLSINSMKKIVGFVVVLSLLSFTYPFDDGILFKVEYKPQSKYTMSVDRVTFTTISYTGSDDFLQKLKDEGVENPKISNKDFRLLAVT